MDRQIQQQSINSPDYKKIYEDMLSKKFPEKILICSGILNKKVLSVLDIIKINQLICGAPDKDIEVFNQKHRFYDQQAILEILEYQKKNELNNSQVSRHFKISRNSVAKWKKMFNI
ncbi:helix-turn-helix domain-containing protein [Chryseobacterium sp. MA9]|uniref:helix-turn-helix domain-containing protein n=1 Tax=Chryseobacterium sp. MA9 TaxID=2966625 RepID=UPI0021065092|nr:helix-turn-helix domain-containing protein [Chryseobacterium sp. MA9]UTX48897.1 helix-turn-helix domain-containing protein [Chryseobacterium sp. MA9]UTX48902.1 helix-turn-helix domain-containing protein [Chryseobacterium sp. MA9]